MKKLNELTVIEVLDGLKNKSFTSVDITKDCYERIEQVEDRVGAFVTLTKDKALEQARFADEEIALKGITVFEEKPLLGVPYACKDNFSTKDILTTASSNVLKNYIPPYESTVTDRLQKAGAVLLGKTNMDAFAHGSTTETSDIKQTHNPWNLDRVPGGSSGGSAAATASDMCIFSIGSETAGSVRGPAAWCGVTGLKPTYGRVSRFGVVAMASSTDSPGPITKTVDDAAYILKIIAGKDPFDATSSPNEVDDYSKALNRPDLTGVRIGKPKSYFEIDLEPGVKKISEDAVGKLKQLGAEIVEMDLLDPRYSIAVYTILQRSEVSSNLARLDGIRYGNGRDYFGFEARKRMMLGAYTLSSGYYDAYYSKAQKVRTLIIEDFNKAFENVDMVIGPTMPSLPSVLGEAEKSSMYGELMDVLSEPSSIAGLPGISVNAGFENEMPVGIQFIGPMFSEFRLIEAAKVFQINSGLLERKPQL